MAAPHQRSDISRLTLGISDNQRLDFWRRGHFPAKIFGSWTLGAATFGAWKFCATDKWRPRLLVAGTIPASDIWRSDIWCPVPLEFETIPVWVKPCPDIQCLGTFGKQDIWLLTFGGQDFRRQPIGGWDIWRSKKCQKKSTKLVYSCTILKFYFTRKQSLRYYLDIAPSLNHQPNVSFCACSERRAATFHIILASMSQWEENSFGTSQFDQEALFPVLEEKNHY